MPLTLVSTAVQMPTTPTPGDVVQFSFGPTGNKYMCLVTNGGMCVIIQVVLANPPGWNVYDTLRMSEGYDCPGVSRLGHWRDNVLSMKP